MMKLPALLQYILKLLSFLFANFLRGLALVPGTEIFPRPPEDRVDIAPVKPDHERGRAGQQQDEQQKQQG